MPRRAVAAPAPELQHVANVHHERALDRRHRHPRRRRRRRITMVPAAGAGPCCSSVRVRGGGVQQRVRDVKVPMRYDGKPCGETSETKACHVAACSKNCVLHRWTRWTPCSKDCDGGTKKRMRMIRNPSEGAGKCDGQWSPKRLQYKGCNMKRCRVPSPNKVMKCDQSMDLVLLLDGTPRNPWSCERA